MRAVVVVLALVMAALPHAREIPSEPVRSVHGPCVDERYVVRPAMGRERVARRVRALIRCAVGRWSVPGGAEKAISVASCESSLWPWVGRSYVGLFQHSARYWQPRVRDLLRPMWFTARQWDRIDADARTNPGAAYQARANVLLSIRMAHRAGWGAWSCA
jgi:hypothetical protein